MSTQQEESTAERWLARITVLAIGLVLGLMLLAVIL
jgi:hypothetical protein